MDEVQKMEQERDCWLEKFIMKHADYTARKNVYTAQKLNDQEEQEKTMTLECEKLKKFVEESKKKSKMIRELLPLLESTANNTNGNEEGAEIVFEEMLTKRFGARSDECANPGFLKEIEDLKEQQEVTQKEIKELEGKILQSDQSNLKQKNDLKFLENDKTVEVRKIQQENAIKGEKIAQMKQEIQTKKIIIAEFNLKYNTFEHTPIFQTAVQPENVMQGHFSTQKDTQAHEEIPSIAVPFLKFPTNALDTPKIAPQTSAAMKAKPIENVDPQTPQKMDVTSGLNFLMPNTSQRKPKGGKISQSQESLGSRPKKIELRRLTDSVGYSAAAHSASNKIHEQEMSNKSSGNSRSGNRRISPRMKSFTESDSDFKTPSKISQSQGSEVARPKKIEIRRKTESKGLKAPSHSNSSKAQKQEMTKMPGGNLSGGNLRTSTRMKNSTEDNHDTKTPPKPKTKGSEKKATPAPQLEDTPKKIRPKAATPQEPPSVVNKGKQAKAQVEKQDQVPDKKKIDGKKPQPSPTSPQDSFAIGSEFSFNMGDDFGNGSIAGENNTNNFDDFGGDDFGNDAFGDDAFGSNKEDSNSVSDFF